MTKYTVLEIIMETRSDFFVLVVSDLDFGYSYTVAFLTLFDNSSKLFRHRNSACQYKNRNYEILKRLILDFSEILAFHSFSEQRITIDFLLSVLGGSASCFNHSFDARRHRID